MIMNAQDDALYGSGDVNNPSSSVESGIAKKLQLQQESNELKTKNSQLEEQILLLHKELTTAQLEVTKSKEETLQVSPP